MSDGRRIAVIALLMLVALFGWGVVMTGVGGGMMAGMGPGMMRGWGRNDATTAASPPIAGAQEIAVQAGDLWFKPATLEMPAAAPVNITVTNDGRLFHDFTIDTFGFRLSLDPGRSATGGLRALQRGEYRFYCSVPGHADAGMRGTLVVTGSR